MLRPVGKPAMANLYHWGQREGMPSRAVYTRALFKQYGKESFRIHVDQSFQFIKEETLSQHGEVSLL